MSSILQMHFEIVDGEIVQAARTIDALDLGYILPLDPAGLLLRLQLLLFDRLVRRG